MNQLEIIQHKILTKEELKPWLNIWRFKGKKIVFTNGCFDIIHEGHVTLLSKASNEGNILIVGLNSNESVKRLKGESRPFNSLEARAKVLAAFQMVDVVVEFGEDTPGQLIQFISPDVLVKGGDYRENEIVGAEFVKQNKGKVVIIPLVEGVSTTLISKKMKG